MAAHRLPLEDAKTLVTLLNQLIQNEGFRLNGTPSAAFEAGRRLGISSSTIRSRLNAAKLHYNLEPNDVPPEVVVIERMPNPIGENFPNLVATALKNRRRSIAELATATKGSVGQILDAVDELRKRGVNIYRSGEYFEIPKQNQESFLNGPVVELVSRPDNTFLFGAAGDLHAGSKYTRWDVREDLYRRFVGAGAQCSFDTGNWIEGMARFNTYDLEEHGLDAQCKLLSKNHPKHDGFKTYAVWGDDHEGWLAQREGIDVGKYNEGIMRDAGHDWTDLGFMEAHVKLVNFNTGKSVVMSVVHPGGGSAYALSYSIQKIVESYEGGEKPAVGLYGHYHKIWSGIVRNVWVVQTGCQQDQTPFMRKKRLEAHVGGALVGLEQDPESGAITSMTPQLIRYFNKGFYENRWSKHGPVTLADRSV